MYKQSKGDGEEMCKTEAKKGKEKEDVVVLVRAKRMGNAD